MPFLDPAFALRLRDPELLLLAAFVPLALWAAWRRRPAAVLFAPAAFAAGLPRSRRQRLRFLPRALQVLGVLGLVLALARPIQRVRQPLEAEGIDVMLCLDLSSSMAATDLAAERSRLDVARAAAAAFVAGRPQDRIGLIGFARYADVVCPPTLDHRALRRILDGLERVAAEGPEDATAIGVAVARAASILRASSSPARVIVLLTDGEENVASAVTAGGIAPAQAAALCREWQVRVYGIAAGRGGPEADPSDMIRLAEDSGGAWFTARDAAALDAIYAAIDELERTRFRELRFRETERFLPILGAALLLLVLGRMLAAGPLEVLP